MQQVIESNDRGVTRLPGACVRKRQHLLLWGIVLIAAILRLYRLDLVEFKADEASHLLRATEIVEQGRLPFVGSRASIGIAKPPLMSLLMAIPVAIGRDPRIASGFIALLNIVAVACCFLLGQRYYGLRVGVLASLLYALNPWAVVLSRKIFTADLLPPFLTLSLYGLHAALVDSQDWGWLVAVLGLGAALLITFSPLPLVVALALLVLYHWRRVRWRYLLAGMGATLFLAVPYLIDTFRHLDELKNTLHSVKNAGSQLAVGHTLHLATQLHSGAGLEALAGVSVASFVPARTPLTAPTIVLEMLFLISSFLVLGLAGWKSWYRRSEPHYTILALWLWIPLLALAFLGTHLQLHYLVILYPAGFLAMAITIDHACRWLLARLPRGWYAALRGAAIGVLLITLAGQAISVVYLYHFVSTYNTAGGYGQPLRYWQRIAQAAGNETRRNGLQEVWIVTEGADLSYEQAPIILNYLLGPDLNTLFLGQGGSEALALPTEEGAVYLLTRSVPEPMETMLAQIGAQETVRIDDPVTGEGARVLVAAGRPLSQTLALIPQVHLARLNSGIELLGYEWPSQAKPGQTVYAATYWQFGDVPEAERVVAHSLFNHLLDASGSRVAQRDGFGLHERHWRAGLLLVQWFALDLPADLQPGEYTWLTGMYRLQDGMRSQVIDEAGNVTSDSIALRPITIDLY